MPPTDDDLRRFLAGTLPAADAGGVAAWVESDPSAGDRLAVLDGPNSLAAALRGGTPFPAGDRAAAALDHLTVELAADGVPAEFRFVRELGRGGMGVVVEAEDVLLRRRVAIKWMLPALAARPDAKARFLREARAMAAVESDHIVPVLHVGEASDGSPYLVMPLLAGETLADRLDRGPLTLDELTAVARDAATGLAAAHANGLIHRDIKPSNLWREAHPDGTIRRVRILDFGLARPVDSAGVLTGSRVVVGTPKYMSPEQARGEPVGPESDLFSLGSVLYRAATNRAAFDGETVTAVLTALAVDDPPPVCTLAPDVPAAFAELIHDLLRKPPAERPTADGVVRRLAGGRPATPRRRWVAAVAGAVAALTVVAAAGVIVIRNGKTEVELADGVLAKVSRDGARTVIEIVGKNPAAPPKVELAPLPRLTGIRSPDEEWEEQTRRLPREEQLAEVLAELRRRNPDARAGDFIIQPTRVNDDAAMQLAAWINTDDARDLTPLRAVTAGRLNRVYLRTQAKRKAFTALDQLRGVPVDGLGLFSHHGIADLAALKGMPLTFLDLSDSPVGDLRPLADLPLKTLRLCETSVTDLAAIRGLKLTYFDYGRAFDPTGNGSGGPGAVSNLEPLKDMPLERLDLGDCKVRDLRPVPTAKLKAVHLWMALPDLSPLTGCGIESLQIVDAYPHEDLIRSLTKLARMSSTTPYQADVPPQVVLDAIDLQNRRHAEFLSAAKELSGEELTAAVSAELETRHREKHLRFGGKLEGNWKPKVKFETKDGKVIGVVVLNQVLDLSPLAALRDVRKVTMVSSPVPDGGFRNLVALPLEELDVQDAMRHGTVNTHLETLGRLPSLKTVNGRPYAEFCKEHGIGPAKPK